MQELYIFGITEGENERNCHDDGAYEYGSGHVEVVLLTEMLCQQRRYVAVQRTPHFGKTKADTQNHLDQTMVTESSLALNQLLMSVFWEACSTSPPIPKITLPTNISPKAFLSPPSPKTKCPAKQNPAVMMSTILAPYLSMRIPPRRGMITLGKAYRE